MKKIKSLSALLLLALIFMQALAASAEDKCESWAARVVSLQGTAEVKRMDGVHWKGVDLHDELCAGDTLRIRENSRAALLLPNEIVVRLDQNSSVTLRGGEKKKPGFFELLFGTGLFFNRSPFGLKVLTPFVNAAAEGTEFVVKVDHSQTYVGVLDGKVNVGNDAGNVLVGKGESALTQSHQVPITSVVVRPQDSVKWALYYPPLPEHHAFISTFDLQEIIEAREFYHQGRVSQALSALPPNVEHPAFYDFRALLFLSVGRVEEAVLDLNRALELDPANSYALSLQSILAVVQNRKDEAFKLASKAVSLDPTSSAAFIAQSYAYQALFNLEGALSSLEHAVAVAPKEPLGWARLAELWLSKGYLDRAMAAAQRAVDVNPSLAHAQTVLGFAQLTQIKLKEARRSFYKAIELDSAASGPRLGLGLVLIREGKLEAGRIEIEIAVALDPGNSLIRSYLGKAYYEEKRNVLAGEQLGLAKELDPMDPTPWFYDAIRKQTLNRPVEALADLEKSIALNGNRAVYRSRLLLDEDLAARSISLARIFADLDMRQLSVTEGVKSLQTDPINYSAHRFLADSYSFLPRHEIARVSELLQSQLLQPLNLYPVQPHLAESKLFLFRGTGPWDPSFNEYNALFNRNRLAFLASSVVGGDSTWGDEVVLSGLWDRMSFSLGQFHYESKGFRPNNDFSRDIYNAFWQVSLSHQTSLQTELRSSSMDQGDLRLFFDPASFFPSARQDTSLGSVRIGFHHALSPESHLLANLRLQEQDIDARFPPFLLLQNESGIGGEVQHLFHSENVKLVTGLGHFNTDRETTTSLILTSSSQMNVPHTNFYIYSLINLPSTMTWTLGGSADFYSNDGLNLDRQQFNPKLGLTWNPLPETTVRAAFFRVFKRTLLSDQTLEPTNVAGFNQFFDDGEATDAWRYGMGLDQKISDKIYAGAEISRRDLVTHGFNVPVEADFREDLLRIYSYWIAHRWLVFGPEYQFERFKNPPALMLNGVEELDSHRLLFNIAFFHPSGFIARLSPTIIAQQGIFQDHLGSVGPGEDLSWVLDASIGYLLPNHWGLITVEARNLLDQRFRFQDTDPSNPSIYPRSLVMVRFTLTF